MVMIVSIVNRNCRRANIRLTWAAHASNSVLPEKVGVDIGLIVHVGDCRAQKRQEPLAFIVCVAVHCRCRSGVLVVEFESFAERSEHHSTQFRRFKHYDSRAVRQQFADEVGRELDLILEYGEFVVNHLFL